MEDEELEKVMDNAGWSILKCFFGRHDWEHIEHKKMELSGIEYDILRCRRCHGKKLKLTPYSQFLMDNKDMVMEGVHWKILM